MNKHILCIKFIFKILQTAAVSSVKGNLFIVENSAQQNILMHPSPVTMGFSPPFQHSKSQGKEEKKVITLKKKPPWLRNIIIKKHMKRLVDLPKSSHIIFTGFSPLLLMLLLNITQLTLSSSGQPLISQIPQKQINALSRTSKDGEHLPWFRLILPKLH